MWEGEGAVFTCVTISTTVWHAAMMGCILNVHAVLLKQFTLCWVMLNPFSRQPHQAQQLHPAMPTKATPRGLIAVMYQDASRTSPGLQ